MEVLAASHSAGVLIAPFHPHLDFHLQCLLRQYLYFCTSNASKLSTDTDHYVCTSKASTFVLVKQVRLH